DYREFLLFAKTYPAATPTPTADVDAFWHFHILDTVKYARDCASAFGYFLHHKPDVEFDDDDQQEELADEAGSAAAYCALARPLEAGAAAYCAAAKPSAYCALTQVGRAKNGGVLRSSRTRKGLLRSRRPAVIRLATVRAD
ncbi:MAG: hypothetical protein JWP59_4280, partial [Massilia sp.]|nr:hypothetical protein [Massilia sp.]